MEIVSAALDYATRLHADQRRESGEPYVRHVIRVRDRLAAAGFDETTQAVGLLHDTLEDTAATFAELEALFGSGIAQRVSALSKLRRGPGQNKTSALSQARLRLFLLSFSAFAEDHPDVLAVKMADQIDNLTDVSAVRDRLARKQAEARELFLPIYRRRRGAMGCAFQAGYDALLAEVSLLCGATDPAQSFAVAA